MLACLLALSGTWYDISAQTCPSSGPGVISVNVSGGNSTPPLTATANDQILSIVGSGNYNGTVDLNGRARVTLCIGNNVSFTDQATILNASGNSTVINNYGRVTIVRFTTGSVFTGTPNPVTAIPVALENGFVINNYNILDFGGPSVRMAVELRNGSQIINRTANSNLNLYGSLGLDNQSSVTNNGIFSVLRTFLTISGTPVSVAGTGNINLGNNTTLTQNGASFTAEGNVVMSNNSNLNVNGSIFTVGGNFTQNGGLVAGSTNILLPGSGCGSINVRGTSTINGGTFGAGLGQVGLCDATTSENAGNFTGFENEPAALAFVPANGRLKCNCFQALPVELLYFRATASAGQVVLNWATASEKDNDYFTLERAADGVTFTEVARTDGAGTSSRLNTYQAVDASPLGGTAYYRLKQTDLDGKFTYSRVVAVKAGVATASARVFPNPVAHDDYVQVDVPGGGVLSVTVFNQIGKQCFSATYPAGTLPSISVGHITRSGGLYILQARRGNTVIREKLVVQ